jgi:hypothetical protein
MILRHWTGAVVVGSCPVRSNRSDIVWTRVGRRSCERWRTTEMVGQPYSSEWQRAAETAGWSYSSEQWWPRREALQSDSGAGTDTRRRNEVWAAAVDGR